MKITFFGAARTVTGSNFLVEAAGKKFLVDCGMYQGKAADELENSDPFGYDVSEIDFMLLTHAHIDHSGRIPKLYNEGFRKPIYATQATCDLCSIMLPDSGHIQEQEIGWRNKKRIREGLDPLPPLYTAEDAFKCLEIFSPVDYDDIVEVDDNISVRFNDAGHMLGSAIIEIWAQEEGKTVKAVFTGDLGNNDIPLLDSPTMISSCDYLVMESTYGSRLHMRNDDKAKLFLDIVAETLDKGGRVIIPSFAVGRTQEILYELDKYKKNIELFEDEIQEKIKRGDNPLEFDGLRFTQTADESKALNQDFTPAIILSASGMCEVGRIKHHLKHNLWNPNSTILFVGYQAPGTLGRTIVDGAKKVKIFGEEIAINARVEYIEGYSGHADQTWLLNFIYSFTNPPKHIFLVHGEYDSQEVLRQKILDSCECGVIIPELGDCYELKLDGPVLQGDSKTARLYKENFRKLDLIDKIEELKDEIEDMENVIMKKKINTEDSELQILDDRVKDLQRQIQDLMKDE